MGVISDICGMRIRDSDADAVGVGDGPWPMQLAGPRQGSGGYGALKYKVASEF